VQNVIYHPPLSHLPPPKCHYTTPKSHLQKGCTANEIACFLRLWLKSHSRIAKCRIGWWPKVIPDSGGKVGRGVLTAPGRRVKFETVVGNPRRAEDSAPYLTSGNDFWPSVWIRPTGHHTLKQNRARREPGAA
jgi:hypothetical protein